MTRTTYPQIEQFETRDRELRADLRLLQGAARREPAGTARHARTGSSGWSRSRSHASAAAEPEPPGS